jgi:uncharacterized protein with PQ loop repeat
MNPRFRAALQFGILVAVLVALFLIFPAAFRFVEMAARELRYFWWVILLIALAAWLIWGLGRKPRE